MNTSEIVHRLRIGLALVVGFLTGKMLAQTLQHHASEFFIGGFMLGFLLTRLAFRIYDQWTGSTPRDGDAEDR
jgi:hypothetical protein